MRIGVVILPEQRWAEAQGVWKRAEELGFAHAWTYDHLAWRSLRDSPWYSAFPVLTAAAGVTSTIRLGPLVASPNFRHPVSFAREIISLDDVSAGRLTVGIGSGGEGWDASILGQEPWSRRERADRFEDFVSLTDKLLREREVTSSDGFYVANGARTYPGCVQRPRVPFAVAGTGPRSIRLAVKYGDIWVTTGGDLRAQTARLEEACQTAGRDATSLDRLVLTGPELEPGLSSPDAFDDTVGQYAELGFTDLVVHWPRAEPPYAGDPATFERIFSR